jgi:ATP-dependent Lon protease
MTPLSTKLNQVFPGRVVRKDLVQRVKKGTNVPTFVLEFLLARYCATDDPDEIESGLQAVNETIQGNFVRSNESNAAQSLVQRSSTRCVWFTRNPKSVIGPRWRPIQISRFDFESYVTGRGRFTRDEWRDALLATIGLEPSRLTQRHKLHYLTRLIPLVEQNYNLIELGPPGTGKSYAFSEFSPYATLISGGQTSTAILFYNVSVHMGAFYSTRLGAISCRDEERNKSS